MEVLVEWVTAIGKRRQNESHLPLSEAQSVERNEEVTVTVD